MDLADRPSHDGCMKALGVALLAACLPALQALAAGPGPARILRVGSSRMYPKPSAAALAAQDGDTIEIDAGEYSADVAIWRANRLTLRGVNGTAHLKAEGKSAEKKAIWVIKGRDTAVENMEFSGCRVPDRNGSDILIEHTEFAANGAGDGYSHNIYIGNVRRFTLRFCWSRLARVGHLVKSRAAENHIR